MVYTPVAPNGTFIASPLGDVTTMRNVGGTKACSFEGVDCVFNAVQGRTEEEVALADLKNEQCQLHSCTSVIWITRAQYGLHRLTR